MPSSSIPRSLFADDTLRLPLALAEAYRAELTARPLAEGYAEQFTDQIQLVLNDDNLRPPPQGDDTIRLLHLALASIHNEGKIRGDDVPLHFARRFATSCARLQLCLLGPNELLDETSDELLAFLSEGQVAVLDVPCGAGAATASLVETLRALRRESVVPRQPLELSCLGADLLPEALGHAAPLLARLPAAELGVRLRCEHTSWDARRADSTAQMMDRWFAFAARCHRYLVVVSNFYGALGSPEAFAAIAPALEQIAGRLANREHLFLWVEPSASPTPKLFDRLRELVGSRLPFLRSRQAVAPAAEATSLHYRCRMCHPLVDHRTYGLDVSVQRYAAGDV